MINRVLNPIIQGQYEREILFFLHTEKPMLSINTRIEHFTRENFGVYYDQLMAYPHVMRSIPIFFKSKEMIAEHEALRTYTSFDLPYQQALGKLLGYPPSATESLYTEKLPDHPIVYVDYYGLKFASSFDAFRESVAWLHGTYTFPATIQDWIQVSHTTAEEKHIDRGTVVFHRSPLPFDKKEEDQSGFRVTEIYEDIFTCF